nr:MAG TPA: hypothetical protein [Caudoviricetes sp.]
MPCTHPLRTNHLHVVIFHMLLHMLFLSFQASAQSQNRSYNVCKAG